MPLNETQTEHSKLEDTPGIFVPSIVSALIRQILAIAMRDVTGKLFKFSTVDKLRYILDDFSRFLNPLRLRDYLGR